MPIADNLKWNFQLAVHGTMAAGGGSAKATVNLLVYRRQSTAPVLNKANMLTAWLAAIKADWKALASSSWTMDKVSLRCLDDPDDAWTDVLVGEAGSVAGDALPNYAAIVFSKKTALRGKHYRGRMYFAGIAEADNVNNALTAGAKTRADTLAALLDDVVADGANNWAAYLLTGLWNFVTVPPTPDVIPLTVIVARKILGRMGSRRTPVVL